MKNKLISLAAAAAVAFSIMTSPVSAASPFVKVVVGDAEIPLSAHARIADGRTLVPLRGVFEALGADVDFEAPGKIFVRRGETEVSLEIGSSEMVVNGSATALDVSARLIGDSTFVPLRAVTEALGGEVEWNDQLKTVIITEEGKQPSADPEITLYSENGDTVSVPLSKAAEYENYGWYLEKRVKMYSIDGRECEVPESEVEENKTVGWYTSKPVRMYSYKGDYTFCAEEDIRAYQSVGWFLYDDFVENTNAFLTKSIATGLYYSGYKYIENIEKNFKDEGIDAAKIEDLRVDYILRWRKALDATIAIVEYEVVTNYEGRRQANITLMNLSEKPINSFELKFSCRDGNGKLTTDSADHDGTITGWSKKANIAGYSKRTFGWVLANNSQTAYISDFEIKNVNEL